MSTPRAVALAALRPKFEDLRVPERDRMAALHSAQSRQERIFATPQHPYTWGLLKSIPRLDTPRSEELVPISGRPPSLINRPSGCHFHPRCPYVREAHRRLDPMLQDVPGEYGHLVACQLPLEMRKQVWHGLQAGQREPAQKG